MIELLKKYFERYFVIKCILLFVIFIISINILLKVSNVIEIYSLNRLANENTKKYLTYMSNNPEELIVNEELIYSIESAEELKFSKSRSSDPTKLKVENGYLLYGYKLNLNKIIYSGNRIFQKGKYIKKYKLYNSPEKIFANFEDGKGYLNIKIDDKIINTKMEDFDLLDPIFNPKTQDFIYYGRNLARKGIYYLNGEKKELGRPFNKIYMSPNGKYTIFESTKDEQYFRTKKLDKGIISVYEGDKLVFKNISTRNSNGDLVFFNEVNDDYYCLIDKNKIYKNGELYIDYSDLLGEYGQITKVKILNNGKVGIQYKYFERDSENKVVNREYGVKIDNKLIFKSSSEIVSTKFSEKGNFVGIVQTNMLIPFMYINYNHYLNEEFIEKNEYRDSNFIFSSTEKYLLSKYNKSMNKYMLHVIDEPIGNISLKHFNIWPTAMDIKGENVAFNTYDRINAENPILSPAYLGVNFSKTRKYKYDYIYKTVYYPKERCFASMAVRDNKIYLVKYWVPSMKKQK